MSAKRPTEWELWKDDPEWREERRAKKREAYHRKKNDLEWLAKHQRQRRESAVRARAADVPSALQKERKRRERDKAAPERVEAKREYGRTWMANKKATDPDFRARQRAALRGGGAGLTPEQIEALRESQDGRCAVCGEIPKPRKNGADGLHLDHRHDNGTIRGMLCGRCNTAAGTLDADPEWLRKLAEYVQRGADPDTHIVAVVEPTRPRLREVS